jgi:hypothetical protein
MSASEKPLHIDIPVKLSDVKMVFSIGALAFEGDLPGLTPSRKTGPDIWSFLGA